MPHPANTEKAAPRPTPSARPTPRYRVRAGNARLGGLILVILALGGLGVAGYAVVSILQQPAPEPGDPAQAGTDASPSGGGMAGTRSIEEILGAVQVYVREEDHDSAQRVLEEAIRSYPADQELRYALGDLYLLTARHTPAYEQYLAGIEIGPETWSAHFTAGTIANTTGNPEIAIGHYQAALRLDPSQPETALYLAAVMQKLNRLDEAKANLALAGKLSPADARVYAMRAEIALRENKPTIALDQARRAREIEPNALGLVLIEARALKRMRETQEAIDLLTALPMAQANAPETVTLLGECLGSLGQFDDAAARVMDAADQHPGDASLCFQAALWLQRADRMEEARAWAQRAVGLGDERAQAWLDSLP